KHAEADIRATALAGYEVVVDQPLVNVQGLVLIDVGDGCGRLQVPPSCEYGQPSKHRLLPPGEQVLAPCDRSSKRLLALGQVSGTAYEHGQRLVQSRQQRSRW